LASGNIDVGVGVRLAQPNLSAQGLSLVALHSAVAKPVAAHFSKAAACRWLKQLHQVLAIRLS